MTIFDRLVWRCNTFGVLTKKLNFNRVIRQKRLQLNAVQIITLANWSVTCSDKSSLRMSFSLNYLLNKMLGLYDELHRQRK